MLYGYGDDRNPYTETVDFLEDLVIEFINEMTHKSMEIGRPGRLQVGCCTLHAAPGEKVALFEWIRWTVKFDLKSEFV